MDSTNQLEMISSCIDLIQTELNVIDIAYAPLASNIQYRVVPNKALLGKKYKKQAGEIYKALETITSKMIDPHGRIKLLAGDNEYIIMREEYTLEPVFDSNDVYDIGSSGDCNILARIDFTYDAGVESLAVVKRLITHIQQTRKIMGLHPWNPISIEFVSDDFHVIANYSEYIKKRLECHVNPSASNVCSSGNEIRNFKLADEDDARMISYFILRLDS
jgi:hypothetical protein